MNEHPEELLPWYANDTLGGEERAQVERHLADCAQCRAELDFLKSVRREVRSLDAVEGPGELARSRLLRDARRSRGAGSRWLPAALAASVAVIALQAALLVWVWPPADRYTPLGSSSAATLQVRFAAQATEEQIRAALEAANASIVDGPGALGVYRIRINANAAQPPADVEAALQVLRRNPEVVIHVEREP